MAIRAAAQRKPRARVMRALTWAFSASARPFEGPPPRVAPMGVLYRDRVARVERGDRDVGSAADYR